MLSDIRTRAVLITFLLVVMLVVLVRVVPQSGYSAEPENNTVTTIRPGTETLFETGVQLLRARHYSQAIDSFRKVLQQQPRMPEAYSNIGFAQYAQDHYMLAAEAFSIALELNPSQLNAYWGLAISLEQLCDLPAARGAMKTFIHLAPENDIYLVKARAALWEWEQAGNKSAAAHGAKDCAAPG
jgi:tetratricopeptide (TPR) repeat protein